MYLVLLMFNISNCLRLKNARIKFQVDNEYQLRKNYSRFILMSILFLLFSSSKNSFASTHIIENWGQISNGNLVQKVTIKNENRMQISYIDYGATITEISVPDRFGKMANVILSLPTLKAYEASQRRYGAIMGRYAGRIGNAKFTLNGKTIQLTSNAKGFAIHGDPNGFDKRVWQRQDFSDEESLGSIFRLLSPDGDQGFPGNLLVQVRYRLMRKSNIFQIEYEASSDQNTVVNLTNHAYFNLAGAGTEGISTHRFKIDAHSYAETDDKRVPTGKLISVKGTLLDFRRAASMDQFEHIVPNSENIAPGYDHSLVFTNQSKKLKPVADILEKNSGRRMQIKTTALSVQLNSGNGFDGSEVGSELRAYQKLDGFAFETQYLPDSPNHHHFPSTTIMANQSFHSLTSFYFSIK